jgi:hypothetical protein
MTARRRHDDRDADWERRAIQGHERRFGQSIDITAKTVRRGDDPELIVVTDHETGSKSHWTIRKFRLRCIAVREPIH